MDSRVDKYYNDLDTASTTQTRSSRNSRLYRQVYDEYGDLEDLPLADNTNEIDMDKLKELISEMNAKEEDNKHDYSYDDLNILEKKKRNIDENKVYDINKLLEKARYENEKLKEPENDLLKTSRNILSKLDNTIDLKLGSDHTNDEDNEKDIKKDNEIDMTREMKYHTKQISTDPLIEQVMPDNDLAMDLFFDLKPTGDTIVTKPVRDNDIKDKEMNKNPFETNDNRDLPKDIFNTNKMEKPEIDNLEDTSDIDVIKNNNKIDEDFFTSSYKFSDKDFNDDDEFFEDSNSGNIIKILLLILVILIFAGVIVYFVLNYGIGVK